MLNHIDIMGRLAREPELRRTNSGTAVCSFAVACERDIAPQGGQKETDFIECVAWRAGAEFVEKYFSKGQMIAVSGRLQNRNWTDKNGNKRIQAEILVDHAYFAGNKPEGGKEPQGAGDYGYLVEPDENCPF